MYWFGVGYGSIDECTRRVPLVARAVFQANAQVTARHKISLYDVRNLHIGINTEKNPIRLLYRTKTGLTQDVVVMSGETFDIALQ